jgi:hypothetical protein
MPQRAITDLWNYTGAVFASLGYARRSSSS